MAKRWTKHPEYEDAYRRTLGKNKSATLVQEGACSCELAVNERKTVNGERVYRRRHTVIDACSARKAQWKANEELRSTFKS